MVLGWVGRVSRHGVTPYLLLALLPLVLLAFNGSWLWDSTFDYDTNVYIGFFRHYLDFTWPYTANYKSSRLPFVLPGVLTYAVLPPRVAHHVLHLGFLIGEAWLVFAVTKPRFGARAAFVAAAALLAFTHTHTLGSYHDQASSMYFIAALALLERPLRFSLPLRLALATGAYAWAVTTNSVIATLAPLFLLRAVAVAVPLSPLQALRNAAAAAAGGVLALAVLGVVNVALGGPFLFFIEQVRYSLGFAKTVQLSNLSTLGMLARVSEFPQLTVPLVTCAAAFWLLVERVRLRRRDWAALEAASLLLAMGIAAVEQNAGLVMLQKPMMFNPFFAPMFLAMPALISGAGRPVPVGEELRSEPPITRFAWLTLALLVAPLSLFGAWTTRLVLQWQSQSPSPASGVPLALALGVLTLLLLSQVRAVAARGVLVAASFGLMNALSPAVTQQAYEYQVGSSCNFRRDAFDAVWQADALLAAFDPKSEARWKSVAVPRNLAQFDGRGWCTILPIETVPRSALLTRYFYTSDALVRNLPDEVPLKKIVLAANSFAQLDQLKRDVWTGLPPGTTARLGLEKKLVFSTFTLTLRGYDLILPP